MKHIILAALCSISVLASCNLKPITYNASMNSDSLIIDNSTATKNNDYEATISFKKNEDTYDYRLPTLITITINENVLTNEDYIYDCDSGKIKIHSNAVVGDIIISGEKIGLESYSATFIGDEHIKFYFYKTRDYTVNPIKDTLARSRDKDTGKQVKDGTGEINFKVKIDENYDIDMFWIRGLYDKCQDSEKTNVEDTYRITNIKGDLEVNVTTKKIYCKKIAISDNLENNSFVFSWVTRKPEKINHIHIKVTADNYIGDFNVKGGGFVFANALENKPYSFSLTPILEGEEVGTTTTYSRAIIKKPKEVSLPRIEINTENNILPTCKEIASPEGAWGTSIVNNEYVQAITKIYDEKNDVIYDSSKELPLEQEYEGSKIKYRGNTSSLLEKKSIKLKLDKKTDLLKNFRINPIQDVNYKHKEWLLLNAGNSLNQLAGFSIAKTLEFEWQPEFQYCSLYINNDFYGVYVLCESVSKGEGKNETQSRYKIDKDGYIIENDAYFWKEDLCFQTKLFDYGPLKYTFKYPDNDEIDEERYYYIKKYIDDFENLLLENNEQCLDFIDKPSYAKWLLAHDIMATTDTAGSNMYQYLKNTNGEEKLKAGTVWDFDSSFSQTQINTLSKIREEKFYYYPWLLKFKTLTDEIKRQYTCYKDKIINDILSRISLIDASSINQLFACESARFSVVVPTLSDQKENLINFLTPHIDYLNNNL